MADLAITIGSTTKQFDLAIEQSGQKLFSIKEEPVVPLRTLTKMPTYGDLPPERILDFLQTTWRGGMGQQNHFDIPDMYADGQGIDTREPNQIYLGPLINTIGAIADTIIGFEFFLGAEYAYSATKVYKLNSGSTAWTTALDVTATDTIECMNQYDGYLYVGLTTGKYYYSADGASWTQCTLANAIAHLLCVAPPYSGTKDMLVLAKRPNEVRTSISPLNAGTGWIDPPYYIGDTTSDITSLFVLNGTLFIGKTDGLYALPVDGRPVALTPEFKEKRDSNNFKYNTNWQGIFYGGVSGDILEIVGTSSQVYSIDYVGPLELSPELALVGSAKGITRDDKNLYAVFLIGSNYIIYTGRQRRDVDYGLRWEWVPLVNLGTNACGAIRVMQRTGANPKLWFAYGTNVANCILSLSPNHPLGDSNYRFCAQGYLITTYFDANYDTWQKILYQFWTVAQNYYTTHQYIKVYYEKDTDTSWTVLFNTILGNGVWYTDLAAIACKKIRLKIELNTDDSSKTPILTEYIYRGILQPEITRTLDFTIVLGQSDSRKVSTDLTFLETGRTAIAPITLKDLRFGTTRYITFLPGSPMEIEFIDEVSKQPSYRARILAQQSNWTPPIS
mgnify:CR=1 FL=1